MTENEQSKEIIGVAMEVHRHLGPGLLESACEEALCYELERSGIPFERQKHQALNKKDKTLKTDYRIDLWVDGKVIVENKACKTVSRIDQAKTLTNLRLAVLNLRCSSIFMNRYLKMGLPI